jgi:DNA-binding Xre family transcriptional regulator
MCYNKSIRFLIHRKELFMAVCYKKLWKLLIDKNMNKTELRMASGITTTALAKLGRDENVNTEVLAKICKTLDCKIEDIMEMVPDVTE